MKRIFLLCSLLFFGLVAFAQDLITNRDIIAMKGSKISDDLVIVKINTSTCDFDLSNQKLMELKDSKISDRVIKQMITKTSTKPEITNDDVINMKMTKLSDDVVRHMIKNCPHRFDASPGGLIKLSNAKVSSTIIKDVMNNANASDTNEPAPVLTSTAKTNNTAVASKDKPAQQAPASKNAEQTNKAGSTTGTKVVKFGEVENAKTLLKMYDKYIASDGSTFQKGDKITLKAPSSNGRQFQYVYEERGIPAKRNYLDARYSNRQLEIAYIKVENAGTSLLLSSKKMKMAQIVTYGIGGLFSEIIIDVENAIASGEIKSNTISENEALEAIKKAKDKYELGLITKQQYDAVITEMKQYIK